MLQAYAEAWPCPSEQWQSYLSQKLAALVPRTRLNFTRFHGVFAVDIETCPKCGDRLRVIACIEDPDVIAIILEHIRARDEA